MPGPLEDPYVYPGTKVLRNNRGLRDPDQLARAEADVTALALAQLAEQGLPGRYDLAHLQAFHRGIFGDLYPWAGEVRTVAISKPGTLFALPQHISSAATDIFTHLEQALVDVADLLDVQRPERQPASLAVQLHELHRGEHAQHGEVIHRRWVTVDALQPRVAVGVEQPPP